MPIKRNSAEHGGRHDRRHGLEHDLRMTGATPMSAWERRGGFEFDRTIEPGGDRMETWPADGPGFSR